MQWLQLFFPQGPLLLAAFSSSLLWPPEGGVTRPASPGCSLWASVASAPLGLPSPLLPLLGGPSWRSGRLPPLRPFLYPFPPRPIGGPASEPGFPLAPGRALPLAPRPARSGQCLGGSGRPLPIGWTRRVLAPRSWYIRAGEPESPALLPSPAPAVAGWLPDPTLGLLKPPSFPLKTEFSQK